MIDHICLIRLTASCRRHNILVCRLRYPAAHSSQNLLHLLRIRLYIHILTEQGIVLFCLRHDHLQTDVIMSVSRLSCIVNCCKYALRCILTPIYTHLFHNTHHAFQKPVLPPKPRKQITAYRQTCTMIFPSRITS